MTDTALIDKNNSAGRFLRLFHKSLGSPATPTVVEVWAQAFDLPIGLSSLDTHHEVSVLLSAADKELRAMETALTGAGIPVNLVKPYIDKTRYALSVSILLNKWPIASQYITPEVLLAFEWFSFHLADEHASAKSEDIQELLESINELEGLMNTETLPSGLKHFISTHLSAIKSALQQVPISGVRPLQQAIRSTLTNLELDKENLQDEATEAENPSALAKAGGLLKKVWKKGAEISGDAEKYAKAGKLLGEGFEVVKGFIT